MPEMKWDFRSSKYEICLIPLTGMAIGLGMYLFSLFCQYFGLGQPCFALMGAALLVLLSGGSALTGFARIAEVRWGKPEILSIPCYFMLYAGSLLLIWKEKQLLLLGTGYVISRLLSALSQVCFPYAKGEKNAFAEETKQQKQTIRIALAAMLGLCFVVCLMIAPILGALQILAAMWVWTYYFYMARKTFGGITRETNGFFQTLCELAMVLVIGILGRIG